MQRLLGLGMFGVVLLGLWIYCIFDVISSDESLIRHLPKTLWLIIVIIVPDIGSIAWLALGRPAYAGWRPGDTESRPARRPRGIEDSEAYPGTNWTPPSGRSEEQKLTAWEADLQRREEALKREKDKGPEEGINPNW